MYDIIMLTYVCNYGGPLNHQVFINNLSGHKSRVKERVVVHPHNYFIHTAYLFYNIRLEVSCIEGTGQDTYKYQDRTRSR